MRMERAWVSLFLMMMIVNAVDTSCADISNKLDRQELQRQAELINMKSEIAMMENRTKDYIDRRVALQESEMDSSFSQLQAAIFNRMQMETSTWKFAVPLAFLWLSMMATAMYIKYKW